MREWIIKYQFTNGSECACDGPVPDVNEFVSVIEKKYYEELKRENEVLKHRVADAKNSLFAICLQDHRYREFVKDALKRLG